MSRKLCVNRRSFLKHSAASVIGVGIAAGRGLAHIVQDPQERQKESLKIKEYRTLGRTGFKVSDIGAGSIMDEGVLSTALDAGVNYIDTAEEYPGHHKIVANAMKGRDRKSVFISTKLEIKEDKSKDGFLKRARKCLEELNSDYVDCLMIHCAETVETLRTQGFHDAMSELKTEGRVHHVGVSNHGSFWFKDPEETMAKILLAAAEDGRFDVFLLAYNFLKMDQAEEVLEAASKKNIGTALMKTTPVALYHSMKSYVERMEKEGKDIDPLYKDGVKRYQDKYDRAQGFLKKYNLQDPKEIKAAAVKFVLGNPDVSTVCCLARTYEDMEGFLRLSGTRLTDLAQAKLDAYREGCGELYCRHACGECEPHCPHGVPINTIMRYHHYFIAQGREKEAMLKYANIPGVKADVCSTCSGHCETACPYNVPIQGKLLLAHTQLTMP
jgi:predicted aldo/keto reductase-like oxidoreductase